MAREMEGKRAREAATVDRLLMGTGIPFTRQVAEYAFLGNSKSLRFRVMPGPRILLSIWGTGWKLFLDLHGTPDEVACRAFPLTLGVYKRLR